MIVRYAKPNIAVECSVLAVFLSFTKWYVRLLNLRHLERDHFSENFNQGKLQLRKRIAKCLEKDLAKNISFSTIYLQQIWVSSFSCTVNKFVMCKFSARYCSSRKEKDRSGVVALECKPAEEGEQYVVPLEQLSTYTIQVFNNAEYLLIHQWRIHMQYHRFVLCACFLS